MLYRSLTSLSPPPPAEWSSEAVSQAEVLYRSLTSLSPPPPAEWSSEAVSQAEVLYRSLTSLSPPPPRRVELGGRQPGGGATPHLPGSLPAQQRQTIGAGPPSRQDHRDASGTAREPARAQLTGLVTGPAHSVGKEPG